MKKYISNLQENERVQITALVSEVHQGITAKHSPYLSLSLKDKTGEINAKFWNVSEKDILNLKAGLFVEVQGDVLKHKEQLQLRVLNAHVLDQDKIDYKDYVQEAYYSKQYMQKTLCSVLETVKDQDLKKVLQYFLEKYKDILYEHPAAAKNHHDYLGGLANHIIDMLDLGECMCQKYQFLNRDLLVAGIIFHDLGKLKELSGPIATSYTLEGKLLGHISIMQAEIAEFANANQLHSEAITLLRHMVLSHHGVYEYGSPVLPMIPEAEILYLLDNIDARMNSLQKHLKQVEPGSFTPRIFSLDNRAFYRSKIGENMKNDDEQVE